MKYAILLLCVVLAGCASAPERSATSPSAIPSAQGIITPMTQSSAAVLPSQIPSEAGAVTPAAKPNAGATATPAQLHDHHSVCQRSLPAAEKLIGGLGDLDHPVSTNNPEAQRFFNQGLTMYYAFNDEEALRSFKRAAEIDPNLAMAYWGMALSVGPNINIDIDNSCEQYAYQQIKMARDLAKSARTSEQDRAYVEALTQRYVSVTPDQQFIRQQLAVDYKVAMAELVRQYPDDPDAATLYAESIMDLRPWQIWYNDGRPKHETEEIITLLEEVLRQHPNHIGANHFYIHALEGSSQPRKALPSADLLPTLAPAAGHLAHMPSHIYIRLGIYDRAVQSNQTAVALDQSNYAPGCQERIDASTCDSVYVGHYLTHNLQFLTQSYVMQGNFEHAYDAARQMADNVRRYVGEQPELERYLATPARLLVAFGKWQMVLDQVSNPAPPSNLMIATSMWHWSRAMAYAALDMPEQASAEQAEFEKAVAGVSPRASWGNNSAGSMLQLAEYMLEARIARMQKQATTEITFLKLAVDAEDGLVYDEPPPWFIATRQALGGALYRSADYKQARQVFSEALTQHPSDGRALFGLFRTLEALKETSEAQRVQKEFEQAWKNADTELDMQDF